MNPCPAASPKWWVTSTRIITLSTLATKDTGTAMIASQIVRQREVCPARWL